MEVNNTHPIYRYPFLTAIINTHNSARVAELLPRALTSVLEQDFTAPWEVIVVNDGPANEDILEAIKPYAKRFDAAGINFISIGTEEESGYQCRPKNVALWNAKGEYIAFLDYDNEWHPQHLSKLYEAMTEGKVWPDFAYCRRKYVRDEGCPEEVKLPGTKEDAKPMKLKEEDSPFIPWHEKTAKMLAMSPLANFIDTSDFMASKGAFWRLGLATGMMWNEKMRRFGDWELFVRGVFYGGWRGKGIDEVLTTYHWTGDNLQLTRPVRETPTGVKV